MAQTIGFGDLNDQQNQNQQNNQQNQGSNGPNTTPGAGQAGSVTNAGAGAPGPTTGAQGAQPAAGNPATGAALAQMARPATYNQQNQGTGFQNLQNYVKANNPSQLQQTVATGLENQNQAVLNNLGQSQQQFAEGTQQNQANTNANQQTIQQILANPTAFTSPAGGAVPNTTGAAGTAGPTQAQTQQGNQFSQLMSGQYQGPTALANASQLQGQAQQAQQNTAGLSTAGGRQAVLQQLLGSPTYNSGEQKFDAALLGQGNSQALNTASAQANALNPMVNQAIAGAQAQGTEQTNAAQQFGQQTQGQFGTAVTNLNNQLSQQAASAQSAQNTAYQQLLTDASSGNLTQQEASQLGVTQGEQVTSDDLAQLNKFISQDPTKATAQNVASAQQYATLNALGQLAGSNAPAAAQDILGQFQGQQGQAGSFSNNPAANVNQSALNSLVTGDASTYASQQTAAQNEVNLGKQFADWSNGQLAPDDIQKAESLGFTAQQLQPGGFGSAAAGQALWNNYLTQQYGAGNTGGNSRGLTTDYGNWAYQNAQQQQAKINAQLQNEYGSLGTFNITPSPTAAPTQDALQAMAQGTVINRNT